MFIMTTLQRFRFWY